MRSTWNRDADCASRPRRPRRARELVFESHRCIRSDARGFLSSISHRRIGCLCAAAIDRSNRARLCPIRPIAMTGVHAYAFLLPGIGLYHRACQREDREAEPCRERCRIPAAIPDHAIDQARPELPKTGGWSGVALARWIRRQNSSAGAIPQIKGTVVPQPGQERLRPALWQDPQRPIATASRRVYPGGPRRQRVVLPSTNGCRGKQSMFWDVVMTRKR